MTKVKKALITIGIGFSVLFFEALIAALLGGELQPLWTLIHIFLICKLFNRGKRLLALIWLPIYWPVVIVTGAIAVLVASSIGTPEIAMKAGLITAWAFRIGGNLALIYLIWWKYDKEEPRTGKNEHIRYFKGGRRL